MSDLLQQVHLRLFSEDLKRINEWATEGNVQQSTLIRQIVHKAVQDENNKYYIFKFVAADSPLPDHPEITYGPAIAIAIARTEDEARKTLLAHAAIQDPPIDSRWLVPGCARVIKMEVDRARTVSWFMI